MKALSALFASLTVASALAQDAPPDASSQASSGEVHRYLVERTFPAGALEGLDAAAKEKVRSTR